MLVNSKKVLIVDDDPGVRDVMHFLLADEGYEVTELDNGHSVLQTVQKVQPDVILLDIMLGGSDGRDVCRSLKSNPTTNNIPIIMISASHTFDSIHKDCCADDYIAKPFDIYDVMDHVRRYAA